MDWSDYFTPVEFTSTSLSSSNFRLLRDDCDDEQLKQAKWTWDISQRQSKEFCSEFGRTFQVNTDKQRFFVVHEPLINERKERSMPLLVFYHGLNSSAWYCALARTNWSKLSAQYNFLVVFGQGQGTFYDHGPIRDQHGHLTFGDLYWEVESPQDDLHYLETILNYMKTKYSDVLDTDRLYFMGYSNGALFSWNVAVHYGGQTFAALCNHCGGFGGRYNEEKMLQAGNIRAVLPIYILTGADDAYKESCLKAQELFQSVNCPVILEIMENRGHSYYMDKEEFLWTQFFLKHRRCSLL